MGVLTARCLTTWLSWNVGKALARSRESPPRGFGEPPEGILFGCQRACQQFWTKESNLDSRIQRPLSYR